MQSCRFQNSEKKKVFQRELNRLQNFLRVLEPLSYFYSPDRWNDGVSKTINAWKIIKNQRVKTGRKPFLRAVKRLLKVRRLII